MTVERVLIADDDHQVLDVLGAELTDHGYEVFLATRATQAVEVARANACDVALIDIDLLDGDALDLAAALSAALPRIAITLMGSASRIAELSDELLASHHTVLTHPVSPGQVLLTVERAAELRRLREENHMLRRQWEEDEGPEDFTSLSPLMVDVLRQAATAADADGPVLVCGAPGTELEILALYIHRCSTRADGPFVRFECGRSAGGTEEADLFGRQYHGANGGIWRTSGRIELAAGGTLFLDNITGLSPASQAQLLRFIDEGRFARTHADQLGLTGSADRPRSEVERHDVRIVCATCFDLNAAVKSEGFREDLLFRLNTLTVTIPPLAQRREDILPLAYGFLRRFSSYVASPAVGMTAEAEQLLTEYDWPGNVAELRDTVRSAVLAAGHELLEPEDLLRGPSRTVLSGVVGEVTGPSLEDAERQIIVRTLHETGGDKAEAARRLCIPSRTLTHKLARYQTLCPAGLRTRGKGPGVRKC